MNQPKDWNQLAFGKKKDPPAPPPPVKEEDKTFMVDGEKTKVGLFFRF